MIPVGHVIEREYTRDKVLRKWRVIANRVPIAGEYYLRSTGGVTVASAGIVKSLHSIVVPVPDHTPAATPSRQERRTRPRTEQSWLEAFDKEART